MSLDLDELRRGRAEVAAQIDQLQLDLKAYDRLITRAASTRASKPAKRADKAVVLTATDAKTPSQQKMVNTALEQLAGTFTKADVRAKIQELFPAATLTEQDVSSILWKMAKNEFFIRVVAKGKPGVPSIYGKTQ